jgi:hypothetical protein
MNIYTKFVARLQLDKAIREAEEAHAKDGDRYYVMPTFGARVASLSCLSSTATTSAS